MQTTEIKPSPDPDKSRFHTVTVDDWRRSIYASRRRPNAVSQQIRIKAGWPEDLTFDLQVETSGSGTYILHFKNDICQSADVPLEGRFPAMPYLGWAYDSVAQRLRLMNCKLTRL